MSEAKKLDPEDRSASGAPEPLVYAPERQGPVVDLRTVSAVPEELGLPALDQRPLAEMPPEPDTALLTMARPLKKRRGRTLLYLFLIGLVAFACGVALASAVVTGMLDLQSGWIKDALHQVKDLLRHKPPT